MMLLSIDPGLNRVGWALWEDAKLLAAGLARAPTKAKALTTLSRVRVVTQAVVDAVKEATGGTSPDVVLVEFPQIYRVGVSRADPSDLVSIALVAAAVAASYPLAVWDGVKPRGWKGTLDGYLMASRIDKSLTPSERAVVGKCPASLRHNVLDAIGLGRWWWSKYAALTKGSNPCE